jgi:hypothetical protein
VVRVNCSRSAVAVQVTIDPSHHPIQEGGADALPEGWVLDARAQSVHPILGGCASDCLPLCRGQVIQELLQVGGGVAGHRFGSFGMDQS